MNRLVLDRWLIGGVLRATFLVAAALAGLLLFFDLLDALDRLGKPGWSVGRILAYTALLQPGRWLEMAPVALLVGTLVALANWARHRELAVLRTSGLSPFGLWRRVALAALIAAGLTMLLGEWVVPVTEQIARRWEENRTPGLWVRDGHDYLHLERVTPNGIERVWRYRLDKEGRRLTAIEFAQSGYFDPNLPGWRFPTGERRLFKADGIVLESLRDEIWKSELTPETLALLWIEPQRMQLTALGHYIAFLKKNGLEATSYEVAYWRKWLLPLTLVVMATLAISFALTHSRTAAMGWRLLAGTFLGVLFYLVNLLSGRLVAIWSLSPPLAAALPSLLFTLLAVLLWWRAERR